MLFQSMVNKAQQQQNNQSYNSQSRQPEGKIKIDHIPETKKSVPDSEGDFIDYEEIK